MSTVGRNTQGVRLIRTIEGEHVVGLQRIDEIEELEIDEIEDAENAVETTDVQSTAPDIEEGNDAE